MMNVHDFATKVRGEGIGYALLSYFSREPFIEGEGSEEMARLWAEAHDAINALDNYMEDYGEVV